MSQKWSKQEDRELVMLIINNMQQGNSCKDAILTASKSLENRTFTACYTRWNKVLKHTADKQLYDKNDYEKNFMTIMIELHQENYSLNMRVSRLERQLEKLMKKLEECEDKKMNKIGFHVDKMED